MFKNTLCTSSRETAVINLKRYHFPDFNLEPAQGFGGEGARGKRGRMKKKLAIRTRVLLLAQQKSPAASLSVPIASLQAMA